MYTPSRSSPRSTEQLSSIAPTSKSYFVGWATDRSLLRAKVGNLISDLVCIHSVRGAVSLFLCLRNESIFTKEVDRITRSNGLRTTIITIPPMSGITSDARGPCPADSGLAAGSLLIVG
jgi:hypothetical protein